MVPCLALAAALVLPHAASAFSCAAAQPCGLGRGGVLRAAARQAPLARPPRAARAAALALRAEVTEQAGRVFGERDCGKFADAKFGHPVVRRYREKTAEGTYESWRMWYGAPAPRASRLGASACWLTGCVCRYHGRDIDFDDTVMKGPTGRVGLAESRDGIASNVSRICRRVSVCAAM